MAKATKAKKAAPDATEAFLAANAPDDLLTTKADTAKMDVNNLERHPLSEKYGPPLEEEELQGLAADIEKHGQHEAIKLFEGKVLAGWNRYRACRMKGIEPVMEEYTGPNAEAVAFGTNVIRRRMSSVAKAYMGALFYTSVGGKQADIAKTCGVSLNRLNQCCQLLKMDSPEAERVREHLRTNPEVTGTNFDEMLLECGIARSNPRTPSNVLPIRDGVPLGEDDLVDPDLDDLEDDLTGGAIDGFGGGEEEPDDDAPSKPRKAIGEGAEPLPAVGGKGPSMKNPHETLVSKLAKHFKGMSAAEQTQFVVFTWGKLQPALQAAISRGEVTFEAPEAKAKPAKPKGAAYVAERKTKAPAKPAGDEKPAPKGKATPAAKKAPTAPAKPAAKAAPKGKKAA